MPAAGVTKAQKRLLLLAKLPVPVTYKKASYTLGAAGYLRSGIPPGYTWLTSQSLTGGELLLLTKRHD